MPGGSVTANVRYINAEWRDRDEVPRIGSRDTRRANTSFHAVDIHDVRSAIETGQAGLDDAGFTMANLVADDIDFTDGAAVETEYYPRIAELALSLTGAVGAYVFNHQYRTEVPPSFNEGYARFVHCDHHLTHCARIAHETLAEWGIEADPQWEYACFNTWQPFDHPVEKNPLAYIDARTLEDGDVIGYYYFVGDRENLVAAPVHNPGHQFCYVPDMQVSEVLFLKQLDDRGGRAVCCPHTSFDDPRSTVDSLPRRSVETRLVCAFEPFQ